MLRPDQLSGAAALQIVAALISLTLWVGSARASESPPSAAAARLDAFVQEVREDYPEIEHLSVAELRSDFPNALLVDVRDSEEFEVSHLPGAVHAPDARAIDALWRADPARKLVFYCTVGVRSAIAAQEFMRRRASSSGEPPAQVANLAGSIFAWANSGAPLVNAAGATQEVHPYSAWWGVRFLDEARAARALRSRE